MEILEEPGEQGVGRTKPTTCWEVLDGGLGVDMVLKGSLGMHMVLGVGVDNVLGEASGVDQVLEGGVDADKVLEDGVGVDEVMVDGLGVDDGVEGGVGVVEVLEDSVGLDEVLEDGVGVDEGVECGVGVGEFLEDSVGVDNVLEGGVGVVEGGVGVVEVLEDSIGVDKVLDEGLAERVDGVRCQVKITTRHSLQLRMANHTARDVYVRLLGHGERISGSGLLALKDSVLLCPLKPSFTPEGAELEETEGHTNETAEAGSAASGTGAHEERRDVTAGEEEEEEEEAGSLTISDTVYSPCASVLPTPVEEARGGVDFLFQSPSHLLKELHADPEVQAELQAERERSLVQETVRQAQRQPANGKQQLGACLRSTARLVTVAGALLLVLLPLLLVLLESNLDVSFLQDIRQTPEFEQFHYEYYCPLRRWFLCKFEGLMEWLWGESNS